MRRSRLAAICVVVLLYTFCNLLFFCHDRLTKSVMAPMMAGEGYTLVLDAGHGGEDGGAVSPNGTIESHINLAITQKLDLIMGFMGTPTTMLRTEDISLHSDNAATIREKKVSDLKYRVATVEAIPNAFLLSIHQNSFTDARYHGAQVFYKGEDALGLAEHIQQGIQIHIDPENNRTVTSVPKDVYLFSHISCPAVLIECGFLSNPMDETLLRQDTYQTKLALTLANSYFTYDKTLE